MIATGAGLHVGDHHHTPLLLFLASFPGRKCWYEQQRSSLGETWSGLMVWLKILQRSGVDLVAYGAEESRQFLANRSMEEHVPPLLYWQEIEPCEFNDDAFRFGLIFYGPAPEDWTVELDRMVEQYVDQFWKMPGLLDENDSRAVPGAWVDDD